MARVAAKKKPTPPARKTKPRLRLVKSAARETLEERIRSLAYARQQVEEARTASDRASEQLREIESKHAELVRKYESTAPGERLSAMASGKLSAVGESKGEMAFARESAALERAISNLEKIKQDCERELPLRLKKVDDLTYYVKSAAREVLAETVDVDALAKSLMKAREAAVADSRRVNVLLSLLPSGSDAHKKLELALYRDINIGNPPATPEGLEIMKIWNALLKGALE